jgi:hypothetical protein
MMTEIQNSRNAGRDGENVGHPLSGHEFGCGGEQHAENKEQEEWAQALAEHLCGRHIRRWRVQSAGLLAHEHRAVNRKRNQHGRHLQFPAVCLAADAQVADCKRGQSADHDAARETTHETG